MSVSLAAFERTTECWQCGRSITRKTYESVGCPFCDPSGGAGET